MLDEESWVPRCRVVETGNRRAQKGPCMAWPKPGSLKVIGNCLCRARLLTANRQGREKTGILDLRR